MDARFDTSRDPRFKKVPQNVRKVQVDKRFSGMFDDKRFIETPMVDSRGKRLHKDSVKNKLREFYELAAGEDKPRGMSEEAKPIVKDISAPKNKKLLRRKAQVADEAPAPEEEDEDDGDEEVAEDEEQEQEESEESADSSEEGDDESVVEDPDEDVARGDATSRLALMGCDWDHTSAGDLLVMLRTYLSSKESRKGFGSGTVDRVAVYPSQYGMERMEKESQSGPAAFTDTGPAEEDEMKINEAMRKYEKQRTKYYYAVAFCDTDTTASWLYDNLDGLDAEGICPGSVDLRFIPDDLVFPYPAKEDASKAPNKYQGPTAQKSAVGHTKVHCSWDEAPAQRKRDLMRKRFTPQELESADLEAYLASSSGEDNEEGAADLKKLARGEDGVSDDSDFFNDDSGDEKKEVEGDMEATFSVGAGKLEEELTERVEEQKKLKAAGGKLHTLDSEKPKSTWASYLDKRKEKRKEAKAKAKAVKDKIRNGGEEDAEDEDAGSEDKGDEKGDSADEGDLALLAMDGEDDDDRGFNVRGKKRQSKKRAAKLAAKAGADGEFKVDTNDPRIARVFASGDFEIDPTNPEFRPSAGMQAVLKKKRARKPKAAAGVESGESARSQAASSGATPSAEPPRSAGLSSGGGGGFSLFAQKRAAPGGEGRQDAGAGKKHRQGRS